MVGQVARDALFLGRFDAELLPWVDMTLFAVVAGVVAVYVRIGRRIGLDRVLSGSLVVFGLVGLAFAALARLPGSAWLYPVVYVWVGIFGVLAPAQVWTLANYVVTPREARRLFGLVGAGATLGATVGGLLSNALARRFGAESLLVAMSCMLLLATALVGRLWRLRHTGVVEREANGSPGRGSLGRSLGVVVTSPHLRAIAGIVLLSSFVTALAGWQMKAIAQQALPGKNALAEFFGAFNAWVGVLCLLTQLLFTAGILRRLGIGQVLLLLPLGLLGGSFGLLAAGTLAAAVILRGVDKVLRYSIDRPAVELLYLPVAPAAKLVGEVVHRHRRLAGRRRPRRPRRARLRLARRPEPRRAQLRQPAARRPVAVPRAPRPPRLRVDPRADAAAAPPGHGARRHAGARPRHDGPARRRGSAPSTRRRSSTRSTSWRSAAPAARRTRRCAACSRTPRPRCGGGRCTS